MTEPRKLKRSQVRCSPALLSSKRGELYLTFFGWLASLLHVSPVAGVRRLSRVSRGTTVSRRLLHRTLHVKHAGHSQSITGVFLVKLRVTPSVPGYFGARKQPGRGRGEANSAAPGVWTEWPPPGTQRIALVKQASIIVSACRPGGWS